MNDAIISGLAFAFLIACAYGLQLVFRKREMTFTTSMLWVIGGLVVIGIGVGLLTSNKRDNTTEISSTSTVAPTTSPESSVPNTYLGISLGDSEQQVRYVLGEPAQRINTVQVQILSFDRDQIPSKMIWLRDGKTILISCSTECPVLLGVNIGDDEQLLKSKLAMPYLESYVNTEPTIVKQIIVGDTPRAVFNLEQLRVIDMGIATP